MDDLFGVTEVIKALVDEEAVNPMREVPEKEALPAQEFALAAHVDEKAADVVMGHTKSRA